MRLPQQFKFTTPAEFNPASAAILGTSKTVPLPHPFPWEELWIFVSIVAGAIGPTFVTGTQQGIDNILNIIRRIVLSVEDPTYGTYQPVNISGIGALSHVSQEGINLPSGTLAAIALSQNGATIGNNQTIRLAYRVPFMPASMGEPLRTRCLLPAHIYKNSPTLQLDFESSANMFSAGSIAQVYVDIGLMSREMSAAQTSAMIADGGFLRNDLIETQFSVPIASTAEVRVPVPVNGSYTGLCIRQYLGGASVTRGAIDFSGIGTTVATGFGAETPLTLELGGNVKHKFRQRHIQDLNDVTRPLNGIVQTSSPRIGGLVAGSTSFSPSSDFYLDFLGDGLSGDTDNELGSLLNANVPVQAGQKWELVWPNVASVATNASLIYLTARKIIGDISRWQTV